MKRYERYRDSGIKWMGEIPEHWESTRIVNLLSLKTERGFANEKLLSVYLDKGVIKNSDSDGKQVHKPSEDLNAYQLVEIGDFVMNNQQCWRGSVGVSQYRGIISPAYHIFKLKDCLLGHYANYLLRDYTMVTQYLIASKGVGSIQRILSFPWFKNSLCIIPPKSEQEQIVRFLDGCLALIDKYVKEKEREVELLKELKNAEINRTVTKGLNPNAEMKDCGIEWIGEIPNHWASLNLRNLLVEKSIKGYPDEMLLSVVREQGVVPRSYDKEENHNVIPSDLSNYKLVEEGDFVINKMKAWQGSCGVSNYKGIVSPAYYVYKITFPLDKCFFHLLLRSKLYVNFFARYSDGIRVGQWDLSAMKLRSIPIWLPPIDEQHAIVAYIQQMEERINKAIAGIEREIELVKEYKTRLVSDVVTGKVDVRDINVSKG